MDNQDRTESAQPLDLDLLIASGARTMRQIVFGHPREPLPAYDAHLPWTSPKSLAGGVIYGSGQGFDVLLTLQTPGQFDHYFLVRLLRDKDTAELFWRVDGDHLGDILVRLVQEWVYTWPTPKNFPGSQPR